MIQVIKRTFDIIKLLSEEKEMGLKDIAEKVGIKKTTACNILKTLVDLGYLKKGDNSSYLLGKGLASIASGDIEKNNILNVAEREIEKLSEKIKEAVLVAVLYKGERYTIAEAQFNQSVTVNTGIFEKTPIYSTATGRLLLAYADERELKGIVNRIELLKNKWQGVNSLESLKKALNQIRSEKIVVKEADGGQVVGLGVPVFGVDKKVCAAVGVYLPTVRFQGNHKKEIISNLIAAGERMSYMLSLAKNTSGGKR